MMVHPIGPLTVQYPSGPVRKVRYEYLEMTMDGMQDWQLTPIWKQAGPFRGVLNLKTGAHILQRAWRSVGVEAHIRDGKLHLRLRRPVPPCPRKKPKVPHPVQENLKIFA